MSSLKTSIISENKNLLLLLASRALTAVAFQMLTVCVGWQMYTLTHSAYYLGLVGLVEFIPMILLTLVVGHVSDRYNRKVIICISLAAEIIGFLLLALGSYQEWISKESILLFIFFIGTANTFLRTPMQTLLPNIVTKEQFPRAAAISASVFQFAVIIGPGLGGILYGLGAGFVYSLSSVLLLLSIIATLFITIITEQEKAESKTMKSIFAGITFIKSKPVILGAISLDLFAVLFGGATALLPIYAGTILNVGSVGLGILRSAPAVGALLTSIILAKWPLKNKVGHIMFTAVIFFGAATIVFAISTSFIFSLLALFVLGASDVVSVVIRSTFVQMETPDYMRGRVNSVNQIFIGTSNQLGEFESGITAAWFGPVAAVLLGGIGTVIVAVLWMRFFPDLLHKDKMTM